MKSTSDKEELKNIIALDEKPLQKNGEIVLIATNRWMPDKCMWTVETKFIKQNIAIVFPFPELAFSDCHVFIGSSESHRCFIHVTPLTSLFRHSTVELEKIRANLDKLNKKQNWHFQVCFFDDNNDELKFRNIISRVLGKKNVSFIIMKPKGYKRGEIILLYQMNHFFYSTQNTALLTAHKDVSSIGSYNSIPIYAYE
jgi:hypothetical protein